VTGEEIDRQIQRLQQQNPRIAVIKDRPTENGDEVVLNYAGFCDGEQFPGGTAENQTLVLGSGMFIPGFEEQLLDKVPGEEVIVKVTFPTSYHAKELAGKAAEFHCKIQEIRVKTQYELDDVFAQEVGGCYTFDEMREALKKSLQEFTDERGQQDLQERLLRQAAATLDYTPTFEEVEKAIDAQMENLEAQLTRQGLNTEMYCNFMNTTKEALREDARHDAEAEVRKDAAIREIVKLESLEVSQEEIGEAVALICRQNKITVDQLKPYYDETFEQAVMKSVLTGKVMRLIAAAADITVV
jgi:trigger factor